MIISPNENMNSGCGYDWSFFESHIRDKAAWLRIFTELPDWGDDPEQDSAMILAWFDAACQLSRSSDTTDLAASAGRVSLFEGACLDDNSPPPQAPISYPNSQSGTPFGQNVDSHAGPKFDDTYLALPEQPYIVTPNGQCSLKNRELYAGWDVRVSGGWKKDVTEPSSLPTPASTLSLSSWNTPRNTLGLYLEEARFSSPERLQLLRETREAQYVAVHEPSTAAMRALPLARFQWPPVLEPPAPSTPPVPASARGLPPGDWLRQPALAGHFLDLLVLDNVYWKKELYGKTGYVDRVPDDFKKGDNAVMKIKIGLAATKVRKIRLVFLEPLTTNELEGFVPKEHAVPINTLWGVQVVIVGPAVNGDRQWIDDAAGPTMKFTNVRMSEIPIGLERLEVTEAQAVDGVAVSSDATADQVLHSSTLQQEFIDVDTFWVPGPQRFFSWEGTAQHRIDVDLGSTSADGIAVEEWGRRSVSASTLESGPSRPPDTIRWAAAFICCICLGTMQNPVVPLCMHIFCYACLYRNLREQMCCPMCRAPIREPPIRDNAFELELFDAIREGLVDAPTAEPPTSPYNWDGVQFAVD
ncbi:hypothetical protein C8J57DRAFT_1532343 [Mycena rebaudengoi]|nr:hypothetical protein C8J57DRAFT_1532343 [Mycena rebaudengoi]